ncbi:MAG: hypothetical protein PG978_000300 [Wolbachia endosymbiont of Ctenocephalides felis wCfeF]|nr:MAG: hypothetical protein PG978_000300 [Wolbachia endosymbiont of Ctenocephalides felis wCfeF]
MQEIYYGFSYQIPMVIGQIKGTVLPVNNGIIQVTLFCHPSARHWDLGYYFSYKYLRNLPDEKKSKRSPVVASYLLLCRNVGVFLS